MEAKINKSEKAKIEILFELSWQEFERYFDKAITELGKNLKIPGFRPGKVPKNMVEKQAGEGRVMEGAAEFAVREEYPKFVIEKEIEVIGNPQIDILKLAKGNAFQFKVKASVLPEIKLPDYKKIAKEIKPKDVFVKDEEVAKTLSWLKESRKNKILNDDEFAKSLGKFENMEALKTNIRQGILKEKEFKERDIMRREILEKIAKEISFDLPESLVLAEKERMFQEIKEIKKEIKDEKELMDSLAKQAEQRTRNFLVLRAIGKQEKISVSDKEVESALNDILRAYPDVEKAKQKIDLDRMKEYYRGMIYNEKVFKCFENFS